MTQNDDHIPVVAAPHWNWDVEGVHLDAPYGFTVDQIVRLSLEGVTERELMQVRVALVTPRSIDIVPRAYWQRVRPNTGVKVVIRIVPSGDDALRSILTIVVAVGAAALGAAWGAAVGTMVGASTAVGTALVTVGVTLLGNLLINALIPPTQEDDIQNTYSISGLKNRAVPNGAVPVVLGKMRVAPPFAALPYTEIVGDDLYIRTLFVLGEGEVSVDDMRIGETSLSEFDEVEIEVRSGIDDDLPVSLYPSQVVEEQIGVELTRPLVRDDLGDVIDGEDAIETPIVRTTGADASGASVILSWPSGLVKFNDDGDKRSHSVKVRIEQRLVEATEWQLVTDLQVTAKKVESFYRQHSWQFPSRARWQVRCTMLTDESTSSKLTQRTNWTALQTLRPEYPLNYSRPLALVALRIKATHQLSGALDTFNCLVSRICLDWDAASATWISRATENPASLYRHILQDTALPTPRTDAQLDLDLLQDWHEFCDLNGLTFNKALSETSTTLRDVMAEITAAGRATPRHDGLTYGIVIDQPLPADEALIVDEISPRNAWNFKTTRSYFEPPHASVVTFLDADNDYKETQRQIRWPDYEGDIEITEELPMSGKVYASEVWREGRRRQLEASYRPDTFEVTQDGRIRTATRGDDVMTSHYSISCDQQPARVKRVFGALIELDDLVVMEATETYALRFRWFETADDVIGQSIVRIVKTVAGETCVLTLEGTGPVPSPDSLVQFGKSDATAFHQIVRTVEGTVDDCSIFKMVAAAPEIDIELAATEIPAWSSRVGAEIDDNLLQPSAPRFSSITSGISGTDTANQIAYLIEAGSGAVPTASFEIDHRLSGQTVWITTTIPVANGGGTIDDYATGDTVEMQARGVSLTGIEGPFTSTVSIIVGEGDADIPAALDEDSIAVTTLLGGALIQIATGDDAATTALQIYRSTSATLDRETDAVGDAISVDPKSSYSTTLGDTTRENLVSGGAMTDAAAWDLDAGWAITDGVATHTAGTTGAIAQSFAATSGKYYRLGFTASAITAGTLTPRLTGSSDRAGTAITADGIYSDRIQAVTGNDTLEFLTDTSFDGTLDDVTAYLETSGCLDQGTHYIWIEPQNADGLNGPVAGPYAITII
ncbi:phage tail protein [Pacificibacter sp. AS14]|uniref:TipJ family phage tail tip protein n=1 Tax=Pacificibacter sp. AS14 TaxID=3135785 RepID=UPI003181C46C